MKLAFLKTSVGECACLFELRYFSLFAPLKHCAQAKKLSEKVCKVWEQLPSTFFSDKTVSLVRRLKVGVKGALWPLYVCCGNSLLELSFHFIYLFLQFIPPIPSWYNTRTWSPYVYYNDCWFCKNRFLCWGNDTICVETLTVNIFARIQ